MSKQTFYKWLKRVILVLGIIPVLLFLAFAGAVSLIDFNQYKPQIEKEVTSYTNQAFKIEGTIDVSILPFVFKVGDLHLKNPEKFGSEHLLSVKEAQIELSLSSLFFSKQIKVVSLELFEPKLHLIKTEQGDNWSDIKGLAHWLKSERATALARPQTASEWFESLEMIQVSLKPEQEEGGGNFSAETSGATVHWAFDSLVVRNGKFQLYDKTNGFAETLLNIDVLAFDVAKDQPFDVSSDFIYQNSLSERIYDVHLNGLLEVDGQFKKMQLTQWHGIFKVGLPEKHNVPDIRLTTQGERFEFEFDTLKATVVNGVLNGLDAQLKTSFSGQFGLNTVLSGTVNIEHLNFKEWAKHLDLPLPKFVDQKALTEGNGQFDWHWDGNLLLLNKMDLQIDESHITGGLLYELQEGNQFNFDLNVDRLNTDLYRAYVPNTLFSPPPSSQKNTGGGENVKTTPSPVTETTASSDVFLPLPVSFPFLQQLNASGQLKMTESKLFDVQISSLDVELLAQQGVLQLAPLDARLYQGELLSRLTIDVNGEQPDFHWKGRMNQIDLAGMEVFPILTGRMVSRFDLKTSGDQLPELKSHLKGLLSVNITEATIHSININSLLAGELEFQPSHTAVQKIIMLGRWSEGEYSARKLDMVSERFSISGAGTFDLKAVEIDTALNLFIERPEGGVKILKGLSVPLTYKGRLGTENASNQALWRVDLASLSSGTDEQKQLLQQFLKLLGQS